MKAKLALAAATAVAGGVLLAVGINAVDSQPKFVEPTKSETSTTQTTKPTRTKAPQVSETTKSPKPTKTQEDEPSPTKTGQDLGAEPTVKTDYANCTEVREDFPKGIPSNHPAYEKKFDRDDDGFACEVD